MGSERKSAIVMPRKSEASYRLLIDTIPHGVQEYDCEGTITLGNRALHKILGYEDGELLGKKIWDFLPSSFDQDALKKYLAGLVKEQPSPSSYQTTWMRKDGTPVDFQIDWNYKRDTKGVRTGFISIITDITEHKKLEKDLDNRTQGFTIILEASKNLTATLDLQNVLQMSVDGITKLAGLDTAAVYLLDGDMLHLRATTPPLPPKFPDEMRVAPLADHPHIQKAVMFNEPVFIADYLKADLTPAERAIAEMRKLRSLLFVPLLLDEKALGIFIVGSIEKHSLLSNFEIDLSLTLGSLAALTIKNAQLYEYNKEKTVELKHALSDQRRAEKERADLEAQLRQAQKMEAIGTLAGGIAHDFNNILAAAIGYTELSLIEAEKGTALYDNLQEVLRAGERAKDLVKQILTFSRQAEQEIKPVQVKLILKEALKFLRASLPTHIEICQDIHSDSLVMADPTQIYQVFMNLCTNAGYAMKEKGGVLTVTLTENEIESDSVNEHPELKPGKYIKLIVSDTGLGMPPHILNRIFDPFFTTKEKDKGTGMGLSVVHGIVGSCEGSISVVSTPGLGSTFNVYLPAVDSQLYSRTAVEEILPTGTEHILFVDDEQAIVKIGEKMLESLGYSVTTRTGSIEALELFKAKTDRFDLVVTDMTMANMSGDELAREMIRINPEIPIILCTGYSSRINPEQAAAIGIRALVYKPVLKTEIATTIRNILDGK